MKSGTIFDNVLITDDEKHAEEQGEELWGKTKDGEKKMKDQQDEEEKKKQEEEDAKKKDEEDGKLTALFASVRVICRDKDITYFSYQRGDHINFTRLAKWTKGKEDKLFRLLRIQFSHNHNGYSESLTQLKLSFIRLSSALSQSEPSICPAIHFLHDFFSLFFFNKLSRVLADVLNKCKTSFKMS